MKGFGDEVMLKRKLLLLSVLFVVGMFVCDAQALTLSTDPGAMLSGSSEFDFVRSGHRFAGKVDYAVYNPGQYTGTLSDFSSFGIFGDDYVYAYQVFNYAESDVVIDFFSVGLLENMSASVDNLTFDSLHGQLSGIDPSVQFVLASSVLSLFQRQEIDAGEHSMVVAYGSEYGPAMHYGQVMGGVTGGTEIALPSPDPVPEPATLLLLAGGCVTKTFLRRRN